MSSSVPALVPHQSVKEQATKNQSPRDGVAADTTTQNSGSRPGAEFAVKLEPNLDIEFATSSDSKPIACTDPLEGVNSGTKPNSLNVNSKSVIKSEKSEKSESRPVAMTATNSVTVPASAAAVPGVSSAMAILATLEQLGFSAPASQFADASLSLQPLAAQFSANDDLPARSIAAGAKLVANSPTVNGSVPISPASSLPDAPLLALFEKPNFPAATTPANQGPDVLTAGSNANASTANSSASFPVSAEGGSESAELAAAAGQSNSHASLHAAYSSSNLAAQTLAPVPQFTASPAAPANALTTPMPADSTAVRSAASQLEAPIPTGATDLTIARIVDLPSIAAPPIQSALSPAAIASVQPSSSSSSFLSLPDNSPEPTTPLSLDPSPSESSPIKSLSAQSASAQSSSAPSPALSTDAVCNSNPPLSSAPESRPTLQPPAIGNNVPVAQPPTGMPSATLPSRDSRIISVPRLSDATTAAPPPFGAPEGRLAVGDNPKAGREADYHESDIHLSDNRLADNHVVSAAINAPNSYAIDSAGNDANNDIPSLTSILFASNFTVNSNSATPAPASDAPIAIDAAGNAKTGMSTATASIAASQITTLNGDKKTIAAANAAASPGIAPSTAASPSSQSFGNSSSGNPPSGNPSTSAPAGSASSVTSSDASLHTVPVVGFGRDTLVSLTAAAPPASTLPAPGSSESAPALPQTHQMLDSAPAPATVPGPPIVPNSVADLQTNGQMHMGVHSEAFGAVEIHTVIQQSQVGITVHADRDIARWFSSEVPGLESGLNNSHLNLTGVNFDHGRSGVQTATGFSNGQPSKDQPRQNSSQTPNSASAGLPGAHSQEPALTTEPATIDIFPSDRSSGSAGNHFSFHV